MNRSRNLLARLCLCTPFLALGCSDAPDDVKEGLVPVTGTVALDTQPVPDGTVSFYPEAALDKPVTGTIKDGGFELNTTPSSKGIAPGKYKVAVTAWKTPPSAGMEGPATPGERLVPEKYGDPATSGLTAEVADKPEGNKIVLDLKSK